MQIKMARRYHFAPIGMAIIKHTSKHTTPTKITDVDEDVEKLESPGTVGENVKWCSHSGKQCDGSSGMKNRELSYDPEIPLLGIYSEESKAGS